MNRRNFVKYVASLTSFTLIDSALIQSLWIPSAFGDTVPLDSLREALHPDDAVMLLPNDKQNQFNETRISYNKRTTLTPTVRVLCNTPEAVSTCILWAKQNSVPLAMRSGGHSYEGFSQSTGIVIDTRTMNFIELSSDASQVTVGAGAMLGQIYIKVSKQSMALPAGSCPTVGVTGHTTGGGYGLLARPFGLACDSLLNIEMVNAQGQLLNVNNQENSDLFWGMRGAGGGNFGIATQLTFKLYRVPKVSTFIASWTADQKTATKLIKAWQAWAPNAPTGITSLFKFTKNSSGTLNVRCLGQTINSPDALTNELKNNIFKIKSPEPYRVYTKSFLDAVNQFAGGWDLVPVYMKGKSDYIKSQISDEGLNVYFSQLPPGIAVIFDSYGGAIRNYTDGDMAFANRDNTICSVQYYTEWQNASDTPAKLNRINNYYNLLRPYVSGNSYVNYCDLDLRERYAQSYWGSNLPRLLDLKKKHDPENIFNHAQSVPLTT